jgi:DNA-directed RNA polymerase specialized sigma24 family protein
MSMSCTTGQLCTATSAPRKIPHTPDVALVRSIAAWLLAIARNKVLSALRRRLVLQSQLIIQEE